MSLRSLILDTISKQTKNNFFQHWHSLVAVSTFRFFGLKLLNNYQRSLTYVSLFIIIIIIERTRERQRDDSIDSCFSMDSRSNGHLWSTNRLFWESFQTGRLARAIADSIRQIIPLFCCYSTRSLAHRWERCKRWTGYLLSKSIGGQSLLENEVSISISLWNQHRRVHWWKTITRGLPRWKVSRWRNKRQSVYNGNWCV